jgi:hypothetical protein
MPAVLRQGGIVLLVLCRFDVPMTEKITIGLVVVVIALNAMLIAALATSRL